MPDRIDIEDSLGRPLYVVEGDNVRPHPEHIHDFRHNCDRCRICDKTKKEILEETA